MNDVRRLDDCGFIDPDDLLLARLDLGVALIVHRAVVIVRREMAMGDGVVMVIRGRFVNVLRRQGGRRGEPRHQRQGRDHPVAGPHRADYMPCLPYAVA